MKLRRVSAAVATTAVLAPAALLAAPVAHAAPAPGAPSVTAGPSEAPSPTTGPSTPAPEPGAPETAAPEEKPGEPGEHEEGGKGQPGETSDPAGNPGAEEPDNAEGTEGPGEGAKGDGAEEGAGAPSEDDGLDECADGEIAEDPELSTTLHGLPSKVVAGSGFHTFTYKVTNGSERAYERVDFGVFAGTVHLPGKGTGNGEGGGEGGGLEETGRYLTLQFKDPDTGTWENVSTDDADADAGYIGFTDVRPHETLTLDLRLSVAEDAPAGLGFALSVGAYVDENGACFLSTGDYYEFDVLKAGARPGEVPGAEPGGRAPQGGKKPLPGKPAGDKEINPVGSLAETGSSDALPVFALAGAAAVALGAGAVFAVRRRGTGGSGA